MTSRAVTRIAFGVVIFFVLTQVVWWIVFQRGYINSVTETTLAQWQRDADAATLLRAEGVAEDELLTLFPRLALNSSGNGFIIDPQVRQAFIGEQNGFTRMFAFEGPFFVLVVLAGLYVIARSLQTERELKRRQQNFLSAVNPRVQDTHQHPAPPYRDGADAHPTARKTARVPDQDGGGAEPLGADQRAGVGEC